MDVTKLPIDVVPNTSPPQFKWRQTVYTIGGTAWQDCSGLLPPSVERSVEKLITMTKQLIAENTTMNKRIIELEKLEEQRRVEGEQRVAAAAPLKRVK